MARTDRAGSGYEEHRYAPLTGVSCDIDAILVSGEFDVGNHQIDAAHINGRNGMFVIFNGRRHRIAGMFQKMFGIEGDKRFVLDDQQLANDAIATACDTSQFFQP